MSALARLEASWIRRVQRDVMPRALATVLATGTLPAIVHAQRPPGTPPPGEPPASSADPRTGVQSDAARHDVRECWRFGFGKWDPALDWRAAGHEGRSPAEFLAAVARGEASRSAAPATPAGATWSSAAGDTALILFPEWWPAGVAVLLEADQAAGDTLRGTATALVADGRVRNPVSRIVAIRRSCDAGSAR